MSIISGSVGKLQRLLVVSKMACDIIQPMVSNFYMSITGETAKLKSDSSVFTIADGIVQHLLVNHLFVGKFRNIVGEEDESNINIAIRPFTVDELTVPEDFLPMIEDIRDRIVSLSNEINPSDYNDLTVFIDPIDGTREFSTSLGEQCSICIGFSDIEGKPVAGLVYRPITQPPTWASGALSEKFTDGVLDYATTPNPKGLLTSNGGISLFIESLMKELGYVRVPSGGAGNKMMMLLEGKGGAYIQDRGVSRWDTCGAQAVIEANGGILSKLTAFEDSKTLSSYTYLKSDLNLDFEAGRANLTPYNVKDKSSIKKGETKVADDVNIVKAYSNLCGLLAINSAAIGDLDHIYDCVQRAKAQHPLSYD
jgi:3'(2'), 5'-bisphosphate nucleotidase